MNIQIHSMSQQQLHEALEVAAQEGWNPGLYDAEAFYQTDPEGFFIATINQKAVGYISAVSYGMDFGFIGLFMVHPDYRGGRVGLELGKCALEKLAKVRTIGIDGLLNKVQNYQALGFEFAYRHLRFEFKAPQMMVHDPAVQKISQPIEEALFKQLEYYDHGLFLAKRTGFLKAWFSIPEATRIVVMRDGNIQGYGMIRRCRQGYKIGPLFADFPQDAELILLELCNSVEPGATVYMDMPEPNPEALLLSRKYSMKEVWGTARMYRGEAFGLEINRIFGVTSLELG